MAWEAGLDPALVARLARPLVRPGLLSLALVRRILGGVEALLGRLPLLERFAHKVRDLAAPETPIVHAHGGGARSEAAAGGGVGAASEGEGEGVDAAPPLPIVRGVERTIERTTVVEKSRLVERERGEPRRTRDDASAPTPMPASATEQRIERVERIERIERVERVERVERSERTERIEPGAPTPPRSTTATSTTEPIEPAAPATRRSRMGAPISHRATSPRDLPALASASRAVTASPAAAPDEAAVIGVPKPPSASPTTIAPHPAPDPARPQVVIARLAASTPDAAPIVHAATPHATSSASATATSADEPIERPAPAAQRSRMGAPIAHRATWPGEPPALVEDLAPALRGGTSSPAAVPDEAAMLGASRPPAASPAVIAPHPAPDPARLQVVIARPAASAPGTTPIVHAAAPRAAASTTAIAARRPPDLSGAAPIVHAAAPPSKRPLPIPTTVTAASATSSAMPAVLPRVGATQPSPAGAPALALPLAHVAPHAQLAAAGGSPIAPPPAALAPPPPSVSSAPSAASASSSPLAPRALAPPAAPPPKLDIHELADHVQRILTRRAMQERERRGLPR
jgi:hypothetical protein